MISTLQIRKLGLKQLICPKAGLARKRAKTQIQVCLSPKPMPCANLGSIWNKRNGDRSRAPTPEGVRNTLCPVVPIPWLSKMPHCIS